MTLRPHPLPVLAVVLVGAACGSGGGQPSTGPDAHTLLTQAKAAVDAASAVHFTISSQNASSSASGTYVTSGDGDAERPDSMTGTLEVVVNGLPVKLGIVSTGGTFYVRLPFTTGYQVTNPSAYGFGDPGKLLDPTAGLSSLLTDASSASLDGTDRLNGEELREVKVTLPGKPIAALLTSADSSQDVQGRIGMVPSSHQVRRVVLTGPFFDPHKSSTFTLILDRYGETVQITPPPH